MSGPEIGELLKWRLPSRRKQDDIVVFGDSGSIASGGKATVYSMPKSRDVVGESRELAFGPRGTGMDFFSFNKAYVDKLRAGDAATQHHFASYFGKFLRIRLRARRLSPDRIDDL